MPPHLHQLAQLTLLPRHVVPVHQRAAGCGPEDARPEHKAEHARVGPIPGQVQEAGRAASGQESEAEGNVEGAKGEVCQGVGEV